MNSKSIGKNLSYNLIFQFITLVLPIITVPYISRVLGAEGIGINSYTNSISQYFILLGSLGIGMYGSREIAYVRDDKLELSRTFWSIAILKFITVSISLILYLFIFGFNKKYGYVYLIQAINILGAMVDITWLFSGLEDFKKTVTRSVTFKIICVIGMFIFVKTPDDLYKYILLNSMLSFGGNLIMWAYIPNLRFRCKINIDDIKKHIVPTLKLFIPQISIQIYVVLDKTMIGLLSSEAQVGLYEQSEKIVKMILCLVTSLGTVMLPRMSNIFAKSKHDEMKRYLNLSLRAVAFISIPMAFGLASISKEFVPWFFGDGFDEIIYLMPVLTPILVLIAFSNVFGMQYLVPTNRTSEFTKSVTCGAIANVVLNLILIYKYKALGACISTVISEFIVTLIQFLYISKNIEKKKCIISISRYIFSSVIMSVIVRILGKIMGAGIVTNLIQCFIGILLYEGMLLVLKEDTNKLFISIVKNKLISKSNLFSRYIVNK